MLEPIEITVEDYKALHRIYEELYPLVEKLKMASDTATHPKSIEYFREAHNKMNKAHLEMSSGLWFVGSGFNFQKVKQ